MPEEPIVTDAERTERLIAVLERLTGSVERIAEAVERPAPGWRRLLDELRAAIGRMPTTVRMRY
jgi:hypothetical protein